MDQHMIRLGKIKIVSSERPCPANADINAKIPPWETASMEMAISI